MDIELKEKVKIFIELNNEFKKNLRWDGRELNSLTALIASECDGEFDEKNIKNIRAYIRKNSKMNSVFRGKFLKVFSIIMNTRDDYKKVFDNTKYIYYSLVDKGFSKNNQTLYASFLLAKREVDEDLEKILSILFKVKKEIEEKEEFKFLREDYIVYAYLTTIDCSYKDMIKKIKIIDDRLKEVKLRESNMKGLFYLSLLLSEKNIELMNEEYLENKLEKSLRIRCSLMGEQNIITEYMYPMIGLSTNFIKDEDYFVEEACNIYNMLKENKKFSRKLKDEEVFKRALNLVLMRYLEYIKADIIDLDIREEGELLQLIEEYVIFSIVV